jgi:hypothetical protein
MTMGGVARCGNYPPKSRKEDDELLSAGAVYYFAIDSRQELWQNGVAVSRLRTGKKRYLTT